MEPQGVIYLHNLFAFNSSRAKDHIHLQYRNSTSLSDYQKKTERYTCGCRGPLQMGRQISHVQGEACDHGYCCTSPWYVVVIIHCALIGRIGVFTVHPSPGQAPSPPRPASLEYISATTTGLKTATASCVRVLGVCSRGPKRFQRVTA